MGTSMEVFNSKNMVVKADVEQFVFYNHRQLMDREFFTVVKDGTVVGILAYYIQQNGVPFLSYVSVHNQFRGQRIATLLMNTFKNDILDKYHKVALSRMEPMGKTCLYQYITQWKKEGITVMEFEKSAVAGVFARR